MSNNSTVKRGDSTGSGHGALGMGGQPADDRRDLASGHEGPTNDERTRPVDGASGGRPADAAGSVAGVPGDNAVTEQIAGRSGS